MSQFGVMNVAGVNLKEVIPESGKLVANEIPISSVVVKRRTVKYNANNGTTFSPSQVPNFSIQSNSDFLVPSSAVLHFKLNNTSTGADEALTSFDDLGTCVINRATCRVSGVMVEDVLDVNKVVNTQVYLHSNKKHYDDELTIQSGAWKWATGYKSDAFNASDVSNNEIQTNDIIDLQRMDQHGVASRQEREAVVEASVKEVNIPLSYMLGLFRSNKLFPLSFLSELKLELLLETAQKAMYKPSGTTATLAYSIEDMYITADVVEVSSDYLRILQQAFNSGEEMGYTLPVNTITTSPQTVSSAGQADLTYSKSTPFLKSIYFRLANSGDDSNDSAYSISGQAYRLATNPNLRLRISSAPFPEYDSLKSAYEIYRHNQVALSHNGNVADSVGISNRNTWEQTGNNNSTFAILFSFEKISGLGNDHYAMDSFDASLSGGIITLQGDYLATTQALACFEHVRVIKFGDRRVDVRA